MSQVNLLPPEIRLAQRRRQTSVIVIVAGGLFLFLLLGYYLLQVNELSGVRADIDDRDRTNASITQQIAEKQKFADLQAEAQAQEAKLALAYQGEVSFSSLLMDTSRVIPPDAYLDSLTLQIAAASEEVTTAGLVGTVSGGGKAGTIDTLATYLTRLESVQGWVNPFISTIGLDPETGGYLYSFTLDLTDEVITPRGKGIDVQE